MSNGIIHKEPACDLTDASLIDAFLKVHTACSDIGPASLEAIRFSSTRAYEGPPDERSIREQLGSTAETGELRTITSISLSLGEQKRSSITIKFSRSPKQSEISFHSPQVEATQVANQKAIKQASTPQPGNPTATESAAKAARLAAAKSLQETIQQLSPQTMRLIAAANSHGLILPKVHDTAHPDTSTIQALAEQIAAFRDVITTQARNNEEMRRRLIEEHDKRTARLFAEHEDRLERHRQDLAAREEDVQGKLAKREIELQLLSEALKDREQRLNLRSERDERRDLRKQIQAAAKQMFEKPDLSTDAKGSFERVAKACRWTIMGAVIVLVVAFFGPPTLEIGLEKVLSAETIWLVWSMRVLAGLTLATALIYYVSSLSAWSRQVSAIELRSKQFALDVDRASWLVEMALEYEKEGNTLPPAMIESFTRGLFESGSQSVAHEQPSASLLHLIQNAESLKVGAAGAELTLTGRQIRKADAQAAKDA